MSYKLDIVNHMLATIGVRKQNSLDNGHPSVIAAVGVLDSANEDFQARGWYFNKEESVRLTPTAERFVYLPKEVTEFAIAKQYLQYLHPDEKLRYVQRGNRVFDTRANTYEIGRVLLADLSYLRDIEELPAAARSYLKQLAAERMAEDDEADNSKLARLADRRESAWAQLMAAHFKATAPNALDSPAAQRLQFRMETSYGNPNLIGGRGLR